MADVTAMHSENAVLMLHANLGYYGAAVPDDVKIYLLQLLDYAFIRLAETAGIHLTPGDLYDDQLQVMYAAWLYRKGGDGAAKPPMLQQAIRDWQLSKAISADEEVSV